MKANTILITNDDGIAAPGLKALAEVMKELGEITIVAPDSPQSGMGHAITINNTLHVEHLTGFLNTQNAYTCSGTPVDCVKMAVHEIMKKKPSICVSGINHGSNSSINVIYSGTMSAAVEAGIEGIPSIGFSFCNYSWEANFEPLKKYVKKITSEVLKNGLPEGVVLNVNFPKTENIMGWEYIDTGAKVVLNAEVPTIVKNFIPSFLLGSLLVSGVVSIVLFSSLFQRDLILIWYSSSVIFQSISS
jgi:5'-nucleotidase